MTARRRSLFDAFIEAVDDARNDIATTRHQCEGCRLDVGVALDRWGDPICQVCIDRMTAAGRTP